MRDTGDHSRPRAGDTSPFAAALAEVRGGSRPEEAAGRLVGELTDRERLRLLHGDLGVLRGSLGWALHGYCSTPIVVGAVPRLGIPGIRFTDGPRGILLGSSTCFPVSMARGATWDPELEERIGTAMGAEARAQGGNLFGGVCVNLLRHPGWGRAQETYGEDPVHVGVMGSALARGAQLHVMACVKHFALNSIEDARFQVDVQVAEDVLHEVYLPHFRRIVDAGVACVMSAYNAVNGRWCGDSSPLLTSILRDEWGFRGFAISDFTFGSRDPVGSVAAGLDVDMPFRGRRARTLPAALAARRLRREDVERAATRIVATQLRVAASVEPETPGLPVVAGPEHRALARSAATRSMVLLRNAPVDGCPVLPVDPRAIRRLAVIGRLATRPNLGDRGSSSLVPPSTVSPLEGLRRGLPGVEVTHEPGADVARAVELAAASDVAVVVVGYGPADEGEHLLPHDDQTLRLLSGPFRLAAFRRLFRALARRLERSGRLPGGDRRRLTLRPEEEALVGAVAAANASTVVVVIGGSAIIMEAWRSRVPAMLLAWYPGMEGGHALADVLTGRAEPGGRLPFVIPADAAHLPFFDPDARRVTYDRWYGYRKLDRDGHEAAFPFGFGLGYTTWHLAGLVVRPGAGDLAATVTLTNSGDRPGSTVVQLYAVLEDGEPDRPRRQLVGFARAALDPGRSVPVRLSGTLAPLSRRDPGTHRWSIVPGRYRFEAGRFLGDPEAAAATLRLGSPEVPATPD